MSSGNKTLNLTDITPKRHKHSSLTIHPYFGKVDPALADYLIKKLSKEGDIVLDPFCGSGTVVHEAIVNNRSVIGWDSSPLAVHICSSKLAGIKDSERNELIEIRNKIDKFIPNVNSIELSKISSFIPSMPRVHDVGKWFTSNSLKELGYINRFIVQNEGNLSSVAVLFLKIAFSRIIIPSSNQQGESSYRSIAKEDSPGRVLTLFIKSINHVISSALKFNDEIQSNSVKRTKFKKSKNGFTFSYSPYDVTIQQLDSRLTDCISVKKKANLVVSSPPYLMSWDYGLYHKFRFYWLGFNLDMYENTEIGRHLRRKKDDVERYTNDMTSTFETLSKSLTKKAKIVLINAPSVVYGKLVDTNKILSECASIAGWKMVDCVSTIDIPGPHHGMYGSLKNRKATAPGEAGKKEHVLIFERDV